MMGECSRLLSMRIFAKLHKGIPIIHQGMKTMFLSSYFSILHLDVSKNLNFITLLCLVGMSSFTNFFCYYKF